MIWKFLDYYVIPWKNNNNKKKKNHKARVLFLWLIAVQRLSAVQVSAQLCLSAVRDSTLSHRHMSLWHRSIIFVSQYFNCFENMIFNCCQFFLSLCSSFFKKNSINNKPKSCFGNVVIFNHFNWLMQILWAESLVTLYSTFDSALYSIAVPNMRIPRIILDSVEL